jgi:homoserine dehydrogenase
MRRSSIVVLKFGSSVLRSEADHALAVHEIYRHVRRGRRVVAVVSATGQATDGLLGTARRVSDTPAPAALAALLATGERASAALLAIALDAAGVPATLLDPIDAGLEVDGPVLDGDPIALDTRCLRRALASCPVVVLAGFFGGGSDGTPTLLGRGGTDLTALFVARSIRARRCKLIKDVAGVYESDPASSDVAPRRYATLTWEDAEAVGGELLQAKALRFARTHRLSFAVRALGSSRGTFVGAARTTLAPENVWPLEPPLRVVLLGLGTVGLGVYRHLAALPEHFRVVRIAVRDPARHTTQVPLALLCDDPRYAVTEQCDVVVELMGGLDPALGVIAAALDAGREVVTANKRLLAEHGPALEARAAAAGVRLRYSAAVGGAVPVLERVRRIARRRSIHRISGVLNGTTNYVLDRWREGWTLEAAVQDAQRKGLAEADATFDLDGSDAAQKLVLVARAAFGPAADGMTLTREGIDTLDPDDVREAARAGYVVRLVATVQRTRDGVQGDVRPRKLPRTHPLARTRDEENCVLIWSTGGARVSLSGRGAGRWPTAEAVIADLLDVVAHTKEAAR